MTIGPDADQFDAAIRRYYDRDREDGRLSSSGGGQLELLRTQELLQRYLPEPPFALDWNDPAQRERMLFAARATEREPSLLGLSAHILAVATA